MVQKILSLFLLFQATTPAANVAPGTKPVSAAMEAAKANKSRMKTQPEVIEQPRSDRPEAARKAGEFGEVTVSGIVDADGKFQEPMVAVSSLSPAIDAAAIADTGRMRFKPALNAQDKPISVPIRLNLEYAQVNFRGSNGLARYTCSQFVKDYDWWHRTWPAEKHDRVYATMRGFSTMADMRSGKKSGDFDAEWKDAIRKCRAAPQKRMVDMLQPHGQLILQMAGE